MSLSRVRHSNIKKQKNGIFLRRNIRTFVQDSKIVMTIFPRLRYSSSRMLKMALLSKTQIEGNLSQEERMAFILATVLLLLLRLSIATTSHEFIGSIGGVTDCSTREGREERIAMEMAVHDFYNLTGYKLVLNVRDLSGISARAASAAIDLIKNQQMQAIVGTLTWQEATLVTEMDDITCKVPILSLATSAIIPSATRAQVLPLIQMVHDISVHMRCIAAIIGYFRWQKVIAIYEDRNAYTSDLSIITLLSDALRDIGAEIEHYSAFPALSSLLDPKTTIQEELKKLTGKQSRVFIVVQSSLPFTTLLFEQAKQMGMMEKGHAWIATDGTTSLLDSLNLSVITSMEGVLGFKTYFLDTVASFKDFKTRFRRKFQSEYPEEEENPDPSVFALRAYDAVWAVAKAMGRLQETSNSRTLLSIILSSNFKGLSSDIRFKNSKLAHAPTFRMVNVVGKRYREMGFWSPKFGFSKNLVEHDSEDKGINSSVSAEEVLGSVYWPGGKTLVPIGLMETTLSNGREKPLQIAVPVRSSFPQLVKVNRDKNRSLTNFNGFSINVFQAALNCLPYELQYKFIPFDGSYDEMVEMVYQKAYDAAIGDIEITADRFQLAQFSQPYVEPGLVMVVPLKSDKSKEPWMFMKPFTKEMWCLMAAMSMITGFVVWFIERRTNAEFGGSVRQQVGTVLWFSFTTLYLGQRESIRSNLSRFVLAPWLFLILIVSASFIASLSSMMTTSRLEPSGLDVGLLRRTNAAVGCDGNSLTANYLIEAFGFHPKNIKRFASIDDHAEALKSGHIRAGFLLITQAKILIAKYCKDFTISGPTYKLGGFGFVFPKNSSLASDFSEAIQRLTENAELKQLEDTMLSLLSCSASLTDTNADQTLGPAPFAGLFILSGGASAIALFIVVARLLRMRWQIMTYIQATLMRKGIWKRAAILPARSHTSDELQLSRRSSLPQTEGNGPLP